MNSPRQWSKVDNGEKRETIENTHVDTRKPRLQVRKSFYSLEEKSGTAEF
jgi:hypothetical protein